MTASAPPRSTPTIRDSLPTNDEPLHFFRNYLCCLLYYRNVNNKDLLLAILFYTITLKLVGHLRHVVTKIPGVLGVNE